MQPVSISKVFDPDLDDGDQAQDDELNDLDGDERHDDDGVDDAIVAGNELGDVQEHIMVSDRESITSSDSDDSELHDDNLDGEGGSVDVHQRSGLDSEMDGQKAGVGGLNTGVDVETVTEEDVEKEERGSTGPN
jgi:hypothetical protein